MFLSLETSYIIRTGLPILVELIDMVNSVTLVFVLQWLSPHLEILIMLLSQYPYTSHYIHKRMPRFIEMLMISLAGWDCLCDHLRDVPCEDIFRLAEVTFFVCTKRANLLNLKWSSDTLVIVAKGFLKLPNLHLLIKQKSPSLPRNLALGTFGKLSIVFSTKVNLL